MAVSVSQNHLSPCAAGLDQVSGARGAMGQPLGQEVSHLRRHGLGTDVLEGVIESAHVADGLCCDVTKSTTLPFGSKMCKNKSKTCQGVCARGLSAGTQRVGFLFGVRSGRASTEPRAVIGKPVVVSKSLSSNPSPLRDAWGDFASENRARTESIVKTVVERHTTFDAMLKKETLQFATPMQTQSDLSFERKPKEEPSK